MKEKKTLTVGIHGLTSCYGCQLAIASVQEILKVTRAFDITYWTMLSSAGRIGPVDVAFVEGSVTTAEDEEELATIRENAEVLVAVGSCAIHGGVQGLLHGAAYGEVFAEIYGDQTMDYEAGIARPVDRVVDVDYRLPGCPPEEPEIMYYLACFAMGSYPEEKDYPVCTECRRHGYPCLLIEKGEPCLGPVIVAGCEARCPGHNVACIGCRGPVPHGIAWFDALARTFREKGMDRERIRERIGIFGRQYPRMDELVEKVFDNED
jgi:sulfhydrogenase subunit delta